MALLHCFGVIANYEKYLFFFVVVAFELSAAELRHLLVKINESGLMNKGHDAISRENFKKVIQDLQGKGIIGNHLSVDMIEKNLLEVNYLLPLTAITDMLRFNDKNFKKVIQDDASKCWSTIILLFLYFQ